MSERRQVSSKKRSEKTHLGTRLQRILRIRGHEGLDDFGVVLGRVTQEVLAQGVVEKDVFELSRASVDGAAHCCCRCCFWVPEAAACLFIALLSAEGAPGTK